MALVEAVSDLTKYDFEKVFKMQAVEFFAFVAYCRWKQEREKRGMEAINKKMIV